MTDLEKVAFMGDPGSANSLATESPEVYVSFLMSPAANELVNGDKDGLRALFRGPAAELGQRIATATPRTLVLAEAAPPGLIKASMDAVIATGTDTEARAFIDGFTGAATRIITAFTTPGVTSLEGLQEIGLQTLDSLNRAGQVVARRTEYTGGVLIDLARKIETKQKAGIEYATELKEFCATVSGQNPDLGQTLTEAIDKKSDFEGLTQLMAKITPDAVVLPKKEAILWILSRGLMDGVVNPQTNP